MSQTILLKPTDLKTYEEGRAAAAITPGMLMELNGDAELIPHGTAGGGGEILIALEDGLMGKTIDDAYADDDLVRYLIARPGQEYNLILLNGENADEDDYLTSDGTGKVKVATGADKKLFKPREALDLSGVGGSDGRIKARVVLGT